MTSSFADLDLSKQRIFLLILLTNTVCKRKVSFTIILPLTKIVRVLLQGLGSNRHLEFESSNSVNKKTKVYKKRSRESESKIYSTIVFIDKQQNESFSTVYSLFCKADFSIEQSVFQCAIDAICDIFDSIYIFIFCQDNSLSKVANNICGKKVPTEYIINN